ncbi:MAG: cobalamin-dependent protein [Candidatus Sungiibacteriota bacterium]|uniref:Cobalamin-dependent protein n=1 Tax=Candidatus Sungiibacteriota bacterium TaxID=2750080 RepID=A0A7T5US94_9BACT|nr:MAG: cobalamin-dependent protein [Candidatus Sungbacteria bacterium]
MALKIGLVQINNEFSGVTYLPLSVADLQVYAQKNVADPGNYQFLLPVYKRIPVDIAVEHLLEADLVGFSLYVWNRNISLEIARRLKQKRPSVITVFGGPEVPDRSEEFLRKNRFVDLACHNEGEQAFVHILEKSFSGEWGEVPSVSFLDPSGNCVQTQWLPRMRSLAVMPSPYLNGTFTPLMEAYPNQRWDALWETNRGCPFFCSFCDWGSNTKNKVIRFDLEILFKELEWFAQHKIQFIFCCDANFGLLPRDVDIARKAAEIKAHYGLPRALSTQNAKNAEERIFQTQKILADAGLSTGVTIAFQSQDPEVLRAVERTNISMDAFRNLQRRFTEAGIDTYSDMLIALPQETYNSFADGVALTIEQGQHNRIQFGNLSMMPNAPMSDPQYVARYGLKTVEVKAVIFHGVIDETPDQVAESEDIVVETSTLTREDWARTRVFCWTTSLLHFDKVFQIPLIVLRQTTGVSYRRLIEVFTEGELEEFPVLKEIQSFFRAKAKSIMAGGIEYCPAPEWLNIYWPVDEFIFIKLCREGKLDQFYDEARRVLTQFFRTNNIVVDEELLRQAIELNQGLIKLPFVEEDTVLTLSYNIWEFYRGVRAMCDVALVRGSFIYRVDRNSEHWQSWEDWYKLVVWYGNKRGAYLYGNIKCEPEKAGHF